MPNLLEPLIRASQQMHGHPHSIPYAQDVTAMYKGFWVAGAAYMTWRLGRGALRRLAAITMNNRRRKRELQNIWGGVEVRALARASRSGRLASPQELRVHMSMKISAQDTLGVP